VRVLFLSDTHLGLDLPARPRVARRRRGDDFFANFHRVLDDAARVQPDLLIHGGDLFFRSRVRASLVTRVFDALRGLADTGVPIVIVPGNHERSRIPNSLLDLHPNIHILAKPQTLTFANGLLAVSGFPYTRDVRTRFTDLLEQTKWREADAPIRLLVIHQIVEGAQVEGYTFRRGGEVIRCRELPRDATAVLCGHVHRHQILRHDLAGQRMPTPVYFPGSIERTSFAERNEHKGYLDFHLEPGAPPGHRFCQLPARPMVTLELTAAQATKTALRTLLARQPADAVVRIRVRGPSTLHDGNVRALAPATMNVSVRSVA